MKAFLLIDVAVLLVFLATLDTNCFVSGQLLVKNNVCVKHVDCNERSHSQYPVFVPMQDIGENRAMKYHEGVSVMLGSNHGGSFDWSNYEHWTE